MSDPLSFDQLSHDEDDVFFLCDRSTRVVVEVSDSAVALAGVPRADLVGRPLDDLIRTAEPSAPVWAPASVLLRPASAGGPLGLSLSVSTMGGRVLVRAVPVAGSAPGRPELKSELLELVEMLPGPAYSLLLLPNGSGRYRYSSPSLEAISGLSLDELAQCPDRWLTLVHPEDRDRVTEQFQRGLRDRAQYQHEYRIIRPDGEVRHLLDWVWFRDGPLESGVLVQGLIRDVTHDRAVEAQLRDALNRLETEQAQLTALVEQMPVGVTIAEASTGRITLTNTKLDEILRGHLPAGTPMDEYGRSRGFRADGTPLAVEDWPLVRALQHGETTFEEEVELERRDGSRAIISLNASPIRDGRGRIHSAVVVVSDITERKAAESRLRLLESAVELASDAVVITEDGSDDPAGQPIVYVNRAFERMTGHRPEEVRGRSLRALNGLKTDGDSLRRIRAAIEANRPIRVEALNTRRDGSEFWVEADITPVRNENGVTTHHVTIQRDVTERKAFLAQLEESRRSLQVTIDTLSQRVAVLDAAGNVLGVNDSWTRFCDATIDERGAMMALGGNYLEVCDTIARQRGVAAAARVADVIRSVLSGQCRSAYEEYRCDALGSERWFGMRVTRCEGDGPTRAVMSHEDLTDRIGAARALAESESRLRTILDNIPAVVFLKDWEHRYLFVNRYCLDILGLRLENVIGRKPEDIVAPPLAELFYDHDRDVMGSLRLCQYEERFNLGDDPRVMLLSEFPLFDQEGSPYALCGISINITELKRTEEQLRRSEARYRVMFQGNPHPMWVFDPETLRILDVSEAALARYGYTREEFQALTILDLLVPEDVAACERVARSTRLGDRYTGLWRHRRRDGSVFDVEISRQTIELDGRPAWLSQGIDVTARLEAERKARLHSEQLNRLAAASAEIHTAGSVEAVLQRAAELAREIVGASLAVVSLVLEPGATPTYASSAAEKFRPIEPLFHRRGISGIEAEILAANRLVRVSAEEVLADPARCGYAERLGEVLRGCLGVPMVARDGTNAGLFQLCDKLEGEFDDADASILTQLAQVAIVAAENARSAAQNERLRGELARSLALLDLVFEAAPTGLAFLDTQDRFARVNPAIAGIVGKAPADLVGRTLRESLPTLADVLEPLHARVVASGEAVVDIEIQGESAAHPGQTRHWLCSFYPVRQPGGVRLGVGQIVWDLTEKHEAEDRIRKLDERLSDVLDSISDGMMILDNDWVIRYVNREGEQLLDQPRDRIVSRTFWEFFPGVEETEFTRYYRRAFETGEPVRFEEYYQPYGRWYEVRAFPTAHGLAIYFHDCSDRHQATQALSVMEERFAMVTRATNDALWDWDYATGDLWWNDGHFERFGYISGEYAPTFDEWSSRIHPEDRQGVVSGFLAAVESGADRWYTEYRYRRKDGTYAYLMDRALCVHGPDGRVTRVIGAMTDLTARREAEEEVRRLNAELEDRVRRRTADLEASNQELEAFSYSVSHDLRAPLRAIAGFSRILQEDHAAELSPEANDLLQLVRTNTLHMDRLIEDLLGLSRYGRMEIRPRPVDQERLVRECLAELAGETEGRKVRFEVGSLPGGLGNPLLIKQIWLNLIANALKYTRKRDEAVIEIGSAPSAIGAGSVSYFVRDNGVGFDMRYVHKLFRVFQRLHRAEEYEGTGVGLAIVKRIAGRHGGRAWAEAEPGRGATFWFTLEPKEEGGPR